MKKILVVDESQAVRETIHMVLGRDFSVAQRSSLDLANLPAEVHAAELLIVGVAPGFGWEPAIFSRVTERFSGPVLFLVDSSAVAGLLPASRGDYLAKPFNPYELKQKVARLLAEGLSASTSAHKAPWFGGKTFRYLEYPYVPASVSALGKKFAETRLPLLILAEAGCGREPAAHAIHALGDGAGPWLSVHGSEASGIHLRDRISPMAPGGGVPSQGLTLFLRDVDSMDFPAQSTWMDFLAEEMKAGRELRLISTSKTDLLEKVYRGEFLASLYYRLATLILRLPPLRARQADIPVLAERLAEEYSENLGLGKVSFSPAAMERLRNYLWFGNVEEMESVIARTLVIHRKQMVDAPDLIFGDFPEETHMAAALKPGDSRPERPTKSAQVLPQGKKSGDASRWTNGHSQEIRILISELAHELKNPMVTVKTFSQLLVDRFDDPTFRVRFQQTVNGDIQRMDDLLEALLDFSRFSQPAKEKVLLYEQLRRVEEELLPECIKKETVVQWGKRGEAIAVFVDKAQFLFAFKNILRAALAQVKPNSAIQMNVEGEGRVAISYFREAVGVNALNEYVGVAAAGNEEALPLRVLLANILLERNGGEIKIDYSDGGRARIWAELPVE
jgi:DNA-binding NtrC family response regulator